jgi:hypothetical protein
MRLTSQQIERIREIGRRVLGDDARITVFGSRADDGKRGGDIDLYFETDTILANRAQAICRLYGALALALGERNIDVLVRDATTQPARIFDIAQRTGVSL